MNIDFTTLSCSFGIPKWWLEANFNQNFETSIQSYMKSMNNRWVTHSAKVRKLGWFVPDYNQIKTTMFKSGFETRPCYDCKTETKFNDVAFAKCFSYKDMPTVQMGDRQIKHFNLFILCGICASKEKPISMTGDPQKAVEVQSTKSKKQLILEAELFEEQRKYVSQKQQFEQIVNDTQDIMEQIKGERIMREPLEKELEEIKKVNDAKRAELEKFAEEKNKLITGFQGCSDIGQTIIEALAHFNDEVKKNTEKLEEATDDYESTFSSEKKCGICWGKIDVYVALKPCFHVYCQKCAHHSRRCPMCNKNVQGHQVVHFP